jgi:hypothetical protein
MEPEVKNSAPAASSRSLDTATSVSRSVDAYSEEQSKDEKCECNACVIS